MSNLDEEELYQEMKEEAYREESHDKKMATDYDYALRSLAISEDSSIRELKDAVDTLNKYGWDLKESDILDTI
jgi:hypothetical protein